MKITYLLSTLTLLLAGTGSAAWSQQIYRCAGAAGAPPEYINNAKDAQTRNCKTMTGGNVTVVQGTAPTAAAPRTPVRVAAAASSGGSTRTDVFAWSRCASRRECWQTASRAVQKIWLVCGCRGDRQ